MAEKGKHRIERIPVELPPVGFRRRMLFNRYAVVVEGDFRLFHFGYSPGANLLVDHFVCAVHFDTLEQQKKENLGYLGRLGDLLLPAPAKWQPPVGGFSVELVTHLAFCRRGSEAEIALHNFSMKALLDFAKTNKPNVVVPAEAIALLRSDVELHKHFIRELYPV